jgi:hypothetical protein
LKAATRQLRFKTRKRFYESPFRPKTFEQNYILIFWTKFHPKQ